MARTLESTEASKTQTRLAATNSPETARRGNALLRQAEGFFTNPKYRTVHLAIITFALLAHLALHYATYYPPLREALGRLPYFRLHSLHEAEYLLIVVYTSLVFRLKGGLIAVLITAVTSLPFLLTPFIFGRQPRPDELRDLTIQVSFILLMGLIISVLYEWVAKERDHRLALAAQIEQSNRELQQRNEELTQVSQTLQSTNSQLNGLNAAVQARLNRLYGDLEAAVEQEQRQLPTLHAEAAGERFTRFLAQVQQTLRDT